MSSATATWSNGQARRRGGPGEGPLDRVLEIGQNSATLLFVCVAVAMLLHAASVAPTVLFDSLGSWASAVMGVVDARIAAPINVEVDPPTKPDEPPPPEPEPETPAAKPVPRDTPEPAAAAAQAGKILAAEPDPNDPVDLTNTFVTGNADTYAGGTTMANGTSAAAVRGPAQANGAVGGKGTAPGTNLPDRSRTVQFSGSTDWKCPWPAEAEALNIDEAFATIHVVVGTDGKPRKADVVSDPGNGFGREARGCALRERYQPALNRLGEAIEGEKTFRVRFERL